MEDTAVFKDIIARLTELCRTALSPTFKTFYEGDPIDIPDANYPCVIIEKVNTHISVAGAPTGNDNIEETISIRLVLNKKDDFGADTDEFDMTERKLRRYVEARDPATQSYHESSLMYALRRHLTMESTIYNNDIDINYDVNPRLNGMVSSEAQITISARGHIPVTR